MEPHKEGRLARRRFLGRFAIPMKPGRGARPCPKAKSSPLQPSPGGIAKAKAANEVERPSGDSRCDAQLGSDTLEAIDAMDLDDSSFPDDEGFPPGAGLDGEVGRAVTPKDAPERSPAGVRRSQRLRDKTRIMSPTGAKMGQDEKMELSSWGLPEAVLDCYLKNGIKRMFPWQAECLSLPEVLEGKNLVYSAPTSAGKTLVAELLLLKRVTESKRKGVFILPFVSVAREKTYYLQEMFGVAGVRVEGFMGSQGPPGGLKATDIAVCTIEKANNIVNRLLEDGNMNELGIIVVDELHMLGDPHRGYLLELLLTKVMFVSARSRNEEGENNIQIVGMSATLPNLQVLSNWLSSELYCTDFRPIPLSERVKIGRSVYDDALKKVRDLDPQLTIKDDSDHLIQLCLETVLGGHSVLVFCPTKAWCEKLAETVAMEFYGIGKADSKYPAELSARLRGSLNSEGIGRVVEALRKCPVGLDKALARSISFGAAFHHAGLTFDERDIIEAGFRNGSIRVLVATSTLSSGVNLPARRVIIRSPVFRGSLLDALIYRQMIGRAGRKGVDTEGESILICREGEKHKGRMLMNSTLPAINSCLQHDQSLTSSMKRAILEVIVSGVATTPEEVNAYCRCTLLAVSLPSGSQPDSGNALTKCIAFLDENEFIRLQETEDGVRYVGTRLGCAVLSSGLSPDEGLHVFGELHRARRCFVLESELHVIYQVTPTYVSSSWPDVDWLTFLNVWEALGEDTRRVAQLVGVEESFIVRAMKGIVNKKVRRQARLLAVHQRFLGALALHDLVREVPLNSVAKKFGTTRGMLQSLQLSASTFAGMVTVFCNRLGWHNLELLVAQFQERLHFGIQRELCDLVRLSHVNGQRARRLYDAGLETVRMVAQAGHVSVENVLRSAAPFRSNKTDEGEVVGPTSGVTLSEGQVAVLMVKEARQLVEKELGITSIDWTLKARAMTTPRRRASRPSPGSAGRRSARGNAWTSPRIGPARVVGVAEGRKRPSPLASTRPTRKSPRRGSSRGYDPRDSWSDAMKENESNAGISNCSQTSKDPEMESMASRGERTAIESDEKEGKGEEISRGKREMKDTKGRTKNKKEVSTEAENQGKRGSLTSGEKICGDVLSQMRVENETPTGILSQMRKETFDEILDKNERNDNKVLRNDNKMNQQESMQGILAEKVDNVDSGKSTTESNGTSNNKSIASLLFGRRKVVKDAESKKDDENSFCVPESQEDKSDNVFSPKSRMKTRGKTGSRARGDDGKRELRKVLLESMKEGAVPVRENFDRTSTPIVPIVDSGAKAALAGMQITPGYGLAEKDNNGGVGSLSESQEEDFLKTLNSQGFNSDYLDFKDQEIEKCEKIDIDIRKGKVLSLENNIEHKTVDFKGNKRFLGNDSSTERSTRDANKVTESGSDVDIVYQACSEEIDFGCDLSEDDVKADDEMNERDVVDDWDGSYLRPSSSARQSSPGDVARQGVRTSDLNQAICEVQDSGDRADEAAMSDSFFDRAFQTYLDAEVSETRVPSPEVDADEACVTFPQLDITPGTEALLEGRVSGDAFKEGTPPMDQQRLPPKGRSRLSDDMFATPPSTPPLGRGQPVTEMTGGLDASHVASSTSKKESLCIVDVANDPRLFEVFLREWGQKETYSLGLACERAPSRPTKGGIGWRVSAHERTPRRSQKTRDVAGIAVENSDLLIVGLAVCWGACDAYYVNLRTVQEEAFSSSLPTPPLRDAVPFEERVTGVQKAFVKGRDARATVRAWDVKMCVRLLASSGLGFLDCPSEDPRVASWMLDPGAKESNIYNLVINHNVASLPLLEGVGSSWGVDGLGINTKNPGSCRVRAATESVVVYHLAQALGEELRSLGMLKAFVDVEMPSVVVLAHMQLNGMGFSNRECEAQKAALQARMTSLEREAYSSVGHPFSLTSPEDIARVLYGELHLPSPDARNGASSLQRTKGGRGRGLRCRGKANGPTHKEALEKLSGSHPLPRLILEWRKISSSLTKVLFPLQQARTPCPRLSMDRVHALVHTFTATGRVTVHEPNLQNVPKDFSIQVATDGTDGRTPRRALVNSRIMAQLAPLLAGRSEDRTVSLRHALVAGPGCVLLSADYSQLELRLLAHLSQDRGLLELLNGGDDVFRMIAAQVCSARPEDVTQEQRQQAKQICYGMIYGMGAKALGEQLNLPEEEALCFMEGFMGRFPGVRRFLRSAVEECRKGGYVLTLMGRRRYLPNIASQNAHARTQSERQAVNTSIQGSAADLVKLAMVRIHSALRDAFPGAPHFLTQATKEGRISGGFLVLQLHDELLYEVASDDIIQVAQLVRRHMEGVHQLDVPLPANVRVGPSWGAMQDLLL